MIYQFLITELLYVWFHFYEHICNFMHWIKLKK